MSDPHTEDISVPQEAAAGQVPAQAPEPDPEVESKLASLKDLLSEDDIAKMRTDLLARKAAKQAREGEQPGMSMAEAVQQFAAQQEAMQLPEAPLARSLEQSMRELLYKRDETGTFQPGALITIPGAIEKITQGELDQAILESSPLIGLRKLQRTLKEFVTTETIDGDEVLKFTPDADADRFEWEAEGQSITPRGRSLLGRADAHHGTDDVIITPQKDATVSFAVIPSGISSVEASIVDTNGTPTGAKRTSEPLLRTVIKEGENITRYSRTKDGIIVAPQDKPAVCRPNVFVDVTRINS
jgi:hypothetical protein